MIYLEIILELSLGKPIKVWKPRDQTLWKMRIQLTVEALEKRIMDAVEKDILSMTEIDKEWADKC